MRILALSPYHGGSHAAFLEGWSSHSRHHFTALTLPAYKWKWRMRHAAVTFAEQLERSRAKASKWDALFCTDMLNLAEFRGLCCATLQRLPAVVYFHENQLTYPVRRPEERDLHFAFTNMTSALSAERVWFNSNFHQDTFLFALDNWLRRLPDFQPQNATSVIRAKSEIFPPGIEPFLQRVPRTPGPLRILWAARWEHDKDPDTFFAALRELRTRNGDFRLRVLGQSFVDTPDCFPSARKEFRALIDHWGFVPKQAEYRKMLQDADVVVSTALHEFFGISVVEAVAAGCYPLVPNRLAYPEILGDRPCFYYDGTASGLADRLLERIRQLELTNNARQGDDAPSELVARFHWNVVARQMDDAIESFSRSKFDVAR